MIAAASRRIITLSETLLTQNKRKDRKYFKVMTTLTISAVFADAVNVRKGSTKAGGENVDQIFSFSPPKAGIVSSGTGWCSSFYAELCRGSDFSKREASQIDGPINGRHVSTYIPNEEE